MSNSIEHDARADTWEEFVQAKNTADLSGARADIEDATRAWRRWLIDFIPAASERLAVPLPRFQRGHQ